MKKMAEQGWAVRQLNFDPTICFSYPSQTHVISVTGDKCGLNCAHCGGHYLKHMKPLRHEAGPGNGTAVSLLISGGCTIEGRVPIREHAAQLGKLKQGRRCNVHVGLAQEDDIAEICKIADKVSFDMVGDDETISEVFGLACTVKDYADSYNRLRDKCSVVPHICIGIHGGEIRGEYRAMEILKKIGVDELSFIIFRPTNGTRFSACRPPGLAAAAKILLTARQEFPDIPIHLGCMRPGGSYRNTIDEWAVRAGINTIVNPTPPAVEAAKSLNLSIVEKKECCVL